MSEHPIDLLSAYLDGDLAAPDREAVERHLAGCRACTAVLEDLGRLVHAAGQLEDREPVTDLWPGIAGRLEGRAPARVVPIQDARPRSRRRFSFTMPQLAAAAIALVVLSGAAVWWGSPRPGDVALDRSVPASGTAQGTGVPVSLEAGPAYSDALADLERAFEASRDRLDPATVATVERNLAIIDEAILQTVEALRADPGSTYLYEHLERSRRQKLDVLRQATLALQTT
ncbi:MAG TPA: zf-HC2 domain-containing protein [Gemmatimonadota bacterium]|nr:zf-HC2 domain-containing protein [Gemmatimonadota bacterium]